MCDKKPCDNCCHEEDLLCCMPLRHCCGGYSEHNNCCPHDRCCNHPCGGCDCCDGCGGCPFGPEPCCCKAMKCCKKCKEELEKLSEKTAGDIGKLNSDVEELDDKLNEEIERATTAEGDLAEAIDAEHDRAVAAETTITHNLDIEINRATDREDQIEDDLAAEVERATGVENNDLIADVEYDSVREELNFKNKNGESICIVDAHAFVVDGMLKDAYVIDYGQDKAIKFIVHTDDGDKEIIVPVGDLLREEDYYKKSVIDGKLLTLKDDVTHTLTWSGYEGGSYDGTANASFTIPNNTNQLTNGADFQNSTQVSNAISSAITTAVSGLDSSATADAGKALKSVTITDGLLTGHTDIAVPTLVSQLTNDEDYQSGQDVQDAIGDLTSTYEPGAYYAVHNIGITSGLLDNSVCSRIAIPNGSVNATAGQALSGITIDQQTGALTGTSIAIPAAQIQSDWNQSNTSASDYIKNKPTIPAAQQQSDWNASSGVTAIANKPTLVTKIQIGTGGTIYNSNSGDTIQIPAYPTGSSINVTINGTTYNLETLLGDLITRITQLETDSLWSLNTTTGYVTAKSDRAAAASAFYDTSVS